MKNNDSKTISNAVISRNYNDRTSPFPWLVRQAGESPELAKACKSITASGVTFGPSDDYESGFGCTVVAKAAEAVAEGFEQKLMKIRFSGNSFEDANGRSLAGVSILELHEDGSMRAAA